jgi:hypothetical protein
MASASLLWRARGMLGPLHSANPISRDADQSGTPGRGLVAVYVKTQFLVSVSAQRMGGVAGCVAARIPLEREGPLGRLLLRQQVRVLSEEFDFVAVGQPQFPLAFLALEGGRSHEPTPLSGYDVAAVLAFKGEIDVPQ